MAYTPFNLGDAVYSFVMHFGLSFLAGVATWIAVSYVLQAFDASNYYIRPPMDIVSKFIQAHRQLFVLALAIAVALIAHTLEDYYFNLF